MPIAPLLVLGVSGSGKTTLAKELATAINGRFLDADDFHPESNIAKMSNGLPLSHEDRSQWLQNLVEVIQRTTGETRPVVLACSVLKESYRQVFKKAFPQITMVYLKGRYYLIRKRLEERPNHFFKADLLKSQFADLEEPKDAIVIEIDQPVKAILTEILEALERRP